MATGDLTRPKMRLHLREASPDDMNYVITSWFREWKFSTECKQVSNRTYKTIFNTVVRYGLLGLEDTKILVGAAEQDPSWIWSWLCYTPGDVPALHYSIVRRQVDDEQGSVPLRSKGIFRTLVAAAGVTSECIYTFRPTSRDAERVMLARASEVHLAARYVAVEDFLERR